MQLLQGSINTGVEITSSSPSGQVIEILNVTSTIGDLTNLNPYEWRLSYQLESVRCRAHFPSLKKAIFPNVAAYNTEFERMAELLDVESKSQNVEIEFYAGEDGVNWRQLPTKKFLWYGTDYLEEIIEYFGGDEFKRLSLNSRLGCKLPQALVATDKLTFEIDAVFEINGFLKVSADWQIIGVGN